MPYNATEVLPQSHDFSNRVTKPSVFFNPSSPSLKTQSKSLAKKGFNPAEADAIYKIGPLETKRNYLQRNLETTVNHVFADSVVSFTNHYRLNSHDEIVTYPDNVLVDIDPEERGGLYRFGLASAIDGALHYPNQLVLLYSPPGPVVFDDNPQNKFREIKPYSIGQLYMMYADDSKVVHNVAIGISSEGEKWLAEIMPDIYKSAKSHSDPIDVIKSFITQPTLLETDVDSFLDRHWNNQDQIIYRNKDKVEFSLAQALNLVRKSLADKLPQSHIVKELMREVDVGSITSSQIDLIYGALAQRYMAENGLDKMKLGGSCGGEEVSFDPFARIDIGNNLSTDYRKLIQGNGIEQLLKTKNERPDYHFKHKPNEKCNKCGAPGENVKLGDCNICEGCQVKFDSGEYS